MILPVQISFRNLKPSEAIEARVREEVSKLETFYAGIVGCRVVVELPHKHHRKGDAFHVRIDLTVPGAELVIRKQSGLETGRRQVAAEKLSKSAEAHAEYKDVFVAIRDAFKEARRKLQDFARRERGQTKIHVPQASGKVVRLFPYEEYGFLETPDGSEIYFHKNSVLNDGFDRLRIGSRVTFSEELGEKGTQASTVRAL
jgi:cold shock CspA family protein